MSETTEIVGIYSASLVPGWRVLAAFETEDEAKNLSSLLDQFKKAKEMFGLCLQRFLVKSEIRDDFPGVFPYTEREIPEWRKAARKWCLITRDLKAQISEILGGFAYGFETEEFLGLWFVSAPCLDEGFEKIL